MKVAVMQPYLFPYIGYFQLISATQVFIGYNDVQFIRRGYINRNRLQHTEFTVPLRAAPRDTTIEHRVIDQKQWERWLKKWRTGLAHSYARAPFYREMRDLTERVWEGPTERIDELARKSLFEVCRYIELPFPYFRASDLDYDRSLRGQDRMIDLLRTVDCSTYVNMIGGRELYEREKFARNEMELRFLRPTLDFGDAKYRFDLSILHLLAYHDPTTCRQLILQNYELIR